MLFVSQLDRNSIRTSGREGKLPATSDGHPQRAPQRGTGKSRSVSLGLPEPFMYTVSCICHQSCWLWARCVKTCHVDFAAGFKVVPHSRGRQGGDLELPVCLSSRSRLNCFHSCRQQSRRYSDVMEISFATKRVLVTGAGQGIGRDLVKKLLDCGAEVVAVSRTKKHLDSLLEEVEGKPLKTVCADLSDWEAAKSAAREAGPVDCLVNNAAVAILAPFLDVKQEEFDTSYNCNVKSIVAVSQVVARGMIERQRGGSIVNVSSQASQAALASHAVYCGTKGAVDMLSKVMALELGPHNIRVNTVNPTVVMTAMGKIGWSQPETAEPMLAKIPLHRFAEVEEVVDAILFLLSDKASMINGVTLPVDGGFLAC